ncbi:hypothetical protein GHT06_016417 [Daphnia sinensis]|uniref:Uncharacterized protein n=1 Tax=Daphnia sinensis TaxID=1820382 RepID=A0AAD5KQ81_9CRUS|nr:hypothetical protein GHT06_016417 [Daphnia sinensis]
MAPLSSRLVLLVFSVVMTTQIFGLKFDKSRNLEVTAGAPAGTIVGKLRVISRAAGGALVGENVGINFSLHNSSDYADFHVDPRSGLLSVARKVDRPVNSTYQIIVRAMLAKSRSGDTDRFEIRVTEPTQPSDESRLLMDSNHYEGEIDPDSPVGMAVIEVMAFVNGSHNEMPGNVTYFMEPFPDEELSFTTIQDWFRMDNRTGVVQLLQSPQAGIKTHNVTFMIGAREHDQSLESRAPAVVLFHGLPRPRNVTVTKLSADAAVICWKFPLAAGAQGYVLRYWRHPASLISGQNDGDSTLAGMAPPVPLELKIIDMDGLPTAVNTTKDEIRTVCSSLKQLESEAAYKLQVLACGGSGDATAICGDSIGPASAILHFTTQTNHCLLEGTCVTGECQILFEPPGFECLCHSGNYGRHCELYDPCVLTPCQNGATCRNFVNGTYECQCLEGFEGENCIVPVGPACLHEEPCLNNGTCSKDGCNCLPGYEGPQCEGFNPCWNDPCPEKANCTVLLDSNEFQCVCPLGFRGLECDEAIDYCILDPCKNDGQCTSKDGFYHCECTSGFRGVDCEQDVDECQSSNPCENNSTCLNLPGSFTCLCPPGFTGARCEQKEEACLSSPCRNKGVCQNDFENHSYTCFCRPGYDGRDCENNIDDCNPDPCLNGATCRDLTDAFECLCKTGFSGLRCDHEDPCPEEMEESIEKGSFHWPSTEVGQTATLACPFGSVTTLEAKSKRPFLTGVVTDTEYRERQERMKFDEFATFAVRSCERLTNGTVSWTLSDLSACREQRLAIAEERSAILENISIDAKNLTQIGVEQVADEVANLVEDALMDLNVAHNFFNTLSNVMEVDDDVLSSSNNSCDRLLDAIERYTSQVHLEPDQPVVLATPNIAIETLFHSKRESYSFRPSFDGDPLASNMISLTIPKEALEGSSDGVRLQFVSYRSGKLFQSRTNRLPGQPAMVLAATVGHLSVSGLSEPVTYTMPLSNSSSFYSCVYWDELEKEWSTKGVKTTKTESGMIKCLSDHLTAFSILLDPTPMDRISGFHEYILRIISYVGSGLSILGLSVTVLLYSLFRNLRRDRGGKILLNLSISLLMLNIIFLVGSILGTAFKNVDLEQRAKMSDRVWAAGTESPVNQAHIDICTALTISVHYLVLSSLSWMLVEAVHMYQLLILVFANSETCFMLKRMVSAWGVPLIIVITTALTSLDYYQDPTGQTCGRMSHDHLTIYYGAFIGPTCLILLINSTVFFMVLRVILMQGQRGRAVGKVATENGNGAGGGNRLMIMAQLRGAVTVMALLGVTWVAGAVAIGPVKVFMTYVFCVCNSLQGFVIFVVRVFQYPEARQSFVTLWNTGQTHIPYDATRHSSGPTINSSGSATGQSSAHAVLRARKTMSINSRSSPRSSGRNMGPITRGPDDSLTPSQAPTLPLGDPTNSSSPSLSYQHWFPSATASPASNGSTQSRFRRIFGQLGLEPSSLRLSSKSNGKSTGSHSLLERHVSGATNPPPSPGDKSHQMLAEASPLPEELIKPNFMIGEEISLLHPALSSEEPSVCNKRSSLISATGASSKEGANTSWTYLRPENEIADDDQMDKGSASALKPADGFIARRRAASFVVNLPNESIQNPLFEEAPDGQRPMPPIRRTQSLREDDSELSVTFRDGQLSLPLREPLFHS